MVAAAAAAAQEALARLAAKTRAEERIQVRPPIVRAQGVTGAGAWQ